MAWTRILPSKPLCALLLCFGFCLSSALASVRVQTISEAREELLARQQRALPTDPPGNSSGPGMIFGNDSIVWSISNCFLMETTGVNMQVQQMAQKDKSMDVVMTSNTSTSTVEGHCVEDGGNGTAIADVTVSFTGLDPKYNVTSASFHMTFAGERFNWVLMNLTMSAKFHDAVNKSEENLIEVPLHTRELFATRGASFYCQNQPGFQANHEGQQITLYFLDLIVEPFVNDTSLGFSPIENCEYAFSIGIWMAIITALIMGMILGLGISMLASIRNMDRFDDPKTSKLLSVPNE